MNAPLLRGVRVVEREGQFGRICARFLASLGAELSRDLDLAKADVLIESEGLRDLEAPHLVHATITAFGSSGPRAHFRGGELVASAMGGVLRMVGDRDRPPVKEALDACVFHAEAAAAAAILIALCERDASGRGQHVDVSIQEVAASRLTNAILAWQFDRRSLERSGRALRYGRAAVRCIWELRDGFVFHSLMSGRFGAPANAALSDWMDELSAQGEENPLRGVDWLAYDRSALAVETRAVWEAAIERFFRARTKAEIASEGERRGINAAVVQAPQDILADPQLASRGFWVVGEHEGRAFRAPGPFVHVRSEGPAALSGGVARTPGPGALANVKVLDLSWAIVGSLTTKALGDHGACVVKVESSQRPCLSRIDVQVERSSRSSLDDKPWFAHLNTSKLGLQLDLKHARVREVLDPLLDWADVVVENFSPGTLAKLGLGYESLRLRRPGLIMLSASAYGQTGPRAQSWGVDGTSAALSGRTLLTGYPDRAPVIPGAVPYADAVVPQFAVASIAAALRHRNLTGRGCYLDVSMYEVSVQQMARALVDAQLGPAPTRAGNREREVWHQGVYPTQGDDRFIAITLFDRADYDRLRQCLEGSWPDPECTPDALDQALVARTRELEDHALMLQLQAAGIAAGVVQDVADLLERDPQLRARPAFCEVDHAALGPFEHQTTPYHLARTPARLIPAPRLGQHTERICRELLRLDPDQYASLQAEGLFR
jgi:crotonobetainyl-CoA:carnitine CoA-transferase CaiB-like acyl-CoA transferase